MRLYLVLLVAAASVARSNALTPATKHGDANSFPATLDTNFIRSLIEGAGGNGYGKRFLRTDNAVDDEDDEERGIFTTAKFKLWLQMGVDPATAYKKLHLPRTYAYATGHENFGKMKKFYEMWLNHKAAKKPAA